MRLHAGVWCTYHPWLLAWFDFFVFGADLYFFHSFLLFMEQITTERKKAHKACLSAFSFAPNFDTFRAIAWQFITAGALLGQNERA
jgi:hypothetical protein